MLRISVQRQDGETWREYLLRHVGENNIQNVWNEYQGCLNEEESNECEAAFTALLAYNYVDFTEDE